MYSSTNNQGGDDDIHSDHIRVLLMITLRIILRMTFGSTDNRGRYKDKNSIPGNQTGWKLLYNWADKAGEKIQLPLYQLSLISIFIPAKQKFISKYNISRCLVCEKSEKLANHLLEIVKLIKCHLDGCKLSGWG